jgi:hypothetical protein
MKYYLTEQQYYTLWTTYPPDITYEIRCKKWQNHLQSKFNLTYAEDPYMVDKGYYGYVKGEEKHITWFLLQL